MRVLVMGETAFVGGLLVEGEDGAEELVPSASWSVQRPPAVR
jgi:hypothetical protein